MATVFLCGVVMVCVCVCVVGREGNYPHNITPHLLSLLRAKNINKIYSQY